MSLRDRLAAEIAQGGPISIAQYMTRCLHDPLDGYYAVRPAIGEDGDFITAPMVSQMFGELIGLWLIEAWRGLGEPARVILAEAGPGDGTLMADMRRALALSPELSGAAEVWLVETSEPLRRAQAARLGGGVRWAGDLAELPEDAPLLLVANELLDCLPARQFERTAAGWAERVVGVGEDGALRVGLAAVATLGGLADTPVGAVLERSAAQEAFAAELGGRLARQGGAALLIDYGRDAPGLGDTLQALRRHQKVDPFATPGEADLTMHADFPAVLAAARAAGADAAMLTQAEFLRRLGVETRAMALTRTQPGRADTIARQLERLTAPDQMGQLFKVAVLWSGETPPPAFEDA